MSGPGGRGGGAGDLRRVLALNAGSSSLKGALFETGGGIRRRVSLTVSGIGGEPRFRAEDADGNSLDEHDSRASGHGGAVEEILDWLEDRGPEGAPDAVAHRIVHGGPDHREPERVDEGLLDALRGLVPFAPDHLPREIEGLETVGRKLPGRPQVVCFDTAFHRHLPEAARVLPLPRDLERDGCFRYGFHGLSFEYIVSELRGRGIEPGALVIAHLGSGASMAAVRDGRSVDTTMGFTPLGGLVMSTRTGDLDPGVLIFLLRERKLPVEELNRLLNRRAGLAGLSGGTADMKTLLEAQDGDPGAALAVEVFCREARKHLAAMAAALGGLDTVVFTGGIGERSAEVRARICAGTEFLGIGLDEAANAGGDGVISAPESRVAVRVLPTDEEAVLARHAVALLGGAE